MRFLQNKLLLFFLLAGFSGQSQIVVEFLPKQEPRSTYMFFGLSLPLRHHFDANAEVDNLKFLPDGINTKFGLGFQYKRLLGAGVHTGTEWRLSEKLIAVPVYANLRIAPEINEDARILVQPGFGWAFGIGHGDLSGYYGKLSIGFEQLDGISYYGEFSEYGFSRDDTGRMRAVSFGIGLTIF